MGPKYGDVMAGRKLSLAELMGKDGAASGKDGALRLSSLPDILGNAMPELPRNPVGRHRLVRALRQRFGANFRSLPGITGLMKEFDSELDVERTAARIRQIKPRR